MKHNVSDIVSGQMDNIIKAPVVDRGHTEHYSNKSANNLQGRVTMAVTIMYGLSRLDSTAIPRAWCTSACHHKSFTVSPVYSRYQGPDHWSKSATSDLAFRRISAALSFSQSWGIAGGRRTWLRREISRCKSPVSKGVVVFAFHCWC